MSCYDAIQKQLSILFLGGSEGMAEQTIVWLGNIELQKVCVLFDLLSLVLRHGAFLLPLIVGILLIYEDHAIHHGSTVSDIILPAVCDCLCLCPADVAFAAFYHSPLCKPFGLECHPKIYPSNCWLLHLRLLHMFQVLMEWTPGCFISLPKLSTCSYVILKLSTSWFPPLCAHKSESIMSDPLKHKTIELHQDLCQGSFCLRQHECQDEGQHVGRMWKLLVGWLASSQARRFLSQTYLTGPVPIPIGRVLNVKWRSGCSLCEMALIWMRFFRVAMAKKYKMAVEMLVAIQCKNHRQV